LKGKEILGIHRKLGRLGGVNETVLFQMERLCRESRNDKKIGALKKIDDAEKKEELGMPIEGGMTDGGILNDDGGEKKRNVGTLRGSGNQSEKWGTKSLRVGEKDS